MHCHPLVPDRTFSLAHASPRQPVWEYILDRDTAALISIISNPYCLVGHTHVPIIFELTKGKTLITYPDYGVEVDLNTIGRSIINPGSVGQPRDSDPRAAYAFLDLEKMTWEFRRVPYDIEITQQRMVEHGLSDRLITRLTYGW